jgi:hypothetical protein
MGHIGIGHGVSQLAALFSTIFQGVTLARRPGRPLPRWSARQPPDGLPTPDENHVLWVPPGSARK